MVKVSVAMCTYNGDKYIKEQLNSLKNQTLPADQVIISDDASSDLTPKIIKEFIKENKLNWELYQNTRNVGFAKNFKNVLGKISGDICFLCDQDDIWEKNKISSAVKVFLNRDVLGLAMGFTFIDYNGQALEKENEDKGVYGFLSPERVKNDLEKIELKEIMHRNIAVGCSCAYRLSIINAFLKSADTTLPHDYQLNALSAVRSGFYFYNVPLTKYRIHKDNTLGLNPVNQTRTEIALEKFKLSSVIRNTNEKTEKLNRFCKKRYNALNSKKLFEVLKLFLNREYYKFYSFKERMGDIVYVL